MRAHVKHLFLSGIIIISYSLHAMVYDNRFFPLLARSVTRTCNHQSSFAFDPFIMSGNNAYANANIAEDEIGIYSVFGPYNQGKVAQALQTVGFANPFVGIPGLDPAKFTGKDIYWDMDGKIETQGFAFQVDQKIWRYCSVGFSVFWMHLFARNRFTISPRSASTLQITVEEALKLDEVRRTMNAELGLDPAVVSENGFSDIDLYVRAGNVWPYLYKFRRVDAGFRAGALIPTGKTRNINNPASIPYGGNGLWGMYFAGDCELELKEDWSVGGLIRFNTRFDQRQNQRLPVVGEQMLYAATQGTVDLESGFTFIFSPYFRIDCIREGFGVQCYYTMIIHNQDKWVDERLVKNPQVDLRAPDKTSSWRSEYLTINAFYDFAKNCPERIAPILTFKWDMPLRLFLAEASAKTNRVMFGIQLFY